MMCRLEKEEKIKKEALLKQKKQHALELARQVDARVAGIPRAAGNAEESMFHFSGMNHHHYNILMHSEQDIEEKKRKALETRQFQQMQATQRQTALKQNKLEEVMFKNLALKQAEEQYY